MNNESLLLEFDQLLANVDSLEAHKLMSINLKKNALIEAKHADQKYWTIRQIFEEYRTFDSDSALVYLNKWQQISKITGHPEDANEINIQRTYIYTATGLFEEAFATLGKVQKDSLTPDLNMLYNEQVLFFATHKDQFLGKNPEVIPYRKNLEGLLVESLHALPKDHPYYPWFLGWVSLPNEDSAKKAIPIIKEITEKSSISTVTDAKNAWILSRLYQKIGDKENHLRYLILSSIADIKASNREQSSLSEIAQILYNQGDLERANSYITYCIRCANEYKSRPRSAWLADWQQKISCAYNEQLQTKDRQLKWVITSMICLLLVVLGLLVLSFYQKKKLLSNKAMLKEINSKLNEKIAEQQTLHLQLQETNEQLHIANEKIKSEYTDAKREIGELWVSNAEKEKYIGNVFGLCSNYINLLDDFRRQIFRLLHAKKYDEVRELTMTPDLPQSQIKELCQNFDRVFLDIYPDFVEDFNKLLRPEEQIRPKDRELLNTELRIYALVRLGLNNSNQIAQFLHCSVRTVYNTRLRVRNKAIVPKEQFAAIVGALGKPSSNS